MKKLLNLFLRPFTPFQLLILSMIGFGILFLGYSDAVRRQWDFAVYYLASKAIWGGINIYNPENLLALSETIEGIGYAGLPYLYLPLTARLISPLSLLPYFAASFVWLVLKCVALEMIIFLTLKLMRQPIHLFSFSILHIAALYFRPIGLDFNSGNVAVFEVALLLGTFWAWRSRQFAAAAVLLVLSSLMKIYPLLLGLYPLHLRDKRFLRYLGVAVIVLILCSLLDFNMFFHYIDFFQSDTWKKMWDEQVQSFYNCSYITVILRTFTDTYFAEPIVELPFLAFILIPVFPVLIFLLMGFVVRKKERLNQFEPTDPEIISLLICGILLLTPRLSGYTLAWVFMPLVHTAYRSVQMKMVGSLVLVLGGIILFQLYLPPQYVPPGIPQLLIDKEFFGLLFIFISSFLVALKVRESAGCR